MTKTRFLLIGLFCIANSSHLLARQNISPTKNKKPILPTLALMFLTKNLTNLSCTEKSNSLFETICKFKNTPNILTEEEKKKLREYVEEETIQLGKELPCIQDSKELKKMEQIHQTLTNLKEQIPRLYNSSFTQPKNIQQPETLRRPHELLIPANGNCLYTSIIFGYLLPLVNSPSEFNQRLKGFVEEQNFPMTHSELTSHYRDLQYLDSDIGFQQIISSLIKQIGIEPGTWGGPKEIGLIADKLNINIQEYTPDPDDSSQLIKGTLHKVNNLRPENTLHIVQDIPLPEELVNSYDESELKQAQISSLQTSQHRHHYRLYYTGTLPESLQEEEKSDDVSYTTDEELHELIIQQNKLGTQDLHTANSHHILGRFYHKQGNYQEAETYYIKAIQIQENKLGKEGPHIAAFYNNLGLLYKNQGKYEQAEKYYVKTIEIQENKLGKDHPDTAISYNNLGGLYNNQGKYEQAEKYYVKAIEIQENKLGKDHSHTAVFYNNLGSLYKNQSKYQQAEKCYVKASKIREDKLGTDDLDTATSYHTLGVLYEAQLNYKEAKKYYMKGLNIAEKKLGKDHYFTIFCRNDLNRIQSLF